MGVVAAEGIAPVKLRFVGNYYVGNTKTKILQSMTSTNQLAQVVEKGDPFSCTNFIQQYLSR